MMRQLLLLVLTLMLALCAEATRAVSDEGAVQQNNLGDARVLLEQAQNAYDHGVAKMHRDRTAAMSHFEEAASLYRQVIDGSGHIHSVENGYLYFNLGNAELQRGDVGRAILAYLKAERYIPGDPRLERNLATARASREDRFETQTKSAISSAIVDLPRQFSKQSLFRVFAFSYIAFWSLILTRLLCRRRADMRRWGGWTWAAAACGVIWLGAGGLLLAEQQVPKGAAGGMRGVILAPSVVVRKGNGEGFAKQFEQPIHAGTEFVTLESRGDWLRIELPNDLGGWIPSASAALVEFGH